MPISYYLWAMLTIKKKYIVNESDEKIAVQVDIKTFERIEKLLEDYVLGEVMKKNSIKERLELKQAKAYYARLKKSHS